MSAPAELHGYEWRLNEDQRSVYEERHWRHGRLHGIGRTWIATGALRRKFPPFFIDGDRVSRAAYQRAQAEDPSLPKLRSVEDRNRRLPDGDRAAAEPAVWAALGLLGREARR